MSSQPVPQHAPSPPLADDAFFILRARVDAWLAEYVACLDGKDIDAWPEFFEEECFYTVLPAENDALGLELALIRCESRAMIKDRAYAIKKTVMYGPRDIRHFFSGLVIREALPDLIRAESNFLIIETLNDAFPRVFAVGRTFDEIVPAGRSFRFKTRRCVYTSNLVPNTLIIPI